MPLRTLIQIGAAGLLLLGVTHFAVAQQPAPTGTAAAAAPAAPSSEIRRFYERRRSRIADDDAEARYELAFELYERYDDRPGGMEALRLAERELEAVVGLAPDDREAALLLRTVSDRIDEALARENPDYLAMLFNVLGGLGIFLFGMKNISEGMQAVAGNRLRRMIGAVTDNRLLATGIGAGVTAMIQSSSITTVIVVGLVNSGVMVLHQAIGVIMGANIGTTLTGWILVLKIGRYGLPILGAALFVYLFSRKDRWRFIAMAVMGLGMIFFGLELMKDGFAPMRDVPTFREAFLWFDAHSYFGVLRCVLVGCILTFIVQSSSATLGITIGLASTGVIPFHTAAALVLGENIGTTITAWLASIGATTAGKRAAYAHVLFNVIGVLWITAFFAVYIKLVGAGVEWAKGTNPLELTLADFESNPAGRDNYAQIVTAAIAATHSGFNIANTLIVLPFVRPFGRLLERLAPERPIKEAPKLTQLDIRMVDSPVLGIEQSRREILKMADGVRKMLAWTRQVMDQREPDQELIRKIFHREQIMDNVQGEVIDFLTDLLSGGLPHAVTEEGREQLRIADEYESISDYISTVLKSHLRLHNAALKLPEQEREHVLELHDMVAAYVDVVSAAVAHRQRDVLSRAHTEGDMITARFKELRDEHLNRLTTEQKVDPVLSMSYNAMLNAYRKIRDHALNIAEAAAGQK